MRGTFLFLIGILDGYSRYLVHHELRSSMEHKDVILVVERAREKFPQANPRVISDRGGQFITREFKQYLRWAGLTQTLISVSYPQSSGKIERFYTTIKGECPRKSSFLSIEDARRIIDDFVIYYNNQRLHNALDYIAPLALIAGRKEEVLKKRAEELGKTRALRVEYFNKFSILIQTPVLSNFR